MAYQSALLHQVDCEHGRQKAIKAICLVGQAMLAHPHLYNRPSEDTLRTRVAAADLPDHHSSSTVPGYVSRSAQQRPAEHALEQKAAKGERTNAKCMMKP